MKSSAMVFLAAFVALSASWSGYVFTAQMQLGRGGQEKAANDQTYPVGRSGVGHQGAEVYRSLGCVYCHSQQIGQEKSIVEVELTNAGTNRAAALAVVAKLNPSIVQRKGEKLLDELPQPILQLDSTSQGDPVLQDLQTVGAKGEVRVSQQGPDMARGWGKRATVAQDFLYENPVQPGVRRIGPDLSNVGSRQNSVTWHLLHLYAPETMVKRSTMPPYRFLFETRRIVGRPSPDALPLSGDLAPKTGFEIVPKEEAKALAAYLVSLNADVPLTESPYTPPTPPPASTNAPATTNAPPK
jgi:cytochrome c oxidase cbb3-type subunit 2